MGAITEDKELTESQKSMLRAFRREVGFVSAEIRAEIAALRRANDELHRRETGEYERLRSAVVRMAKSLLALFGAD